MKRRWARRVYLDLFAGPGLCITRSQPKEVVDGSPIVALKLKDPFTHYIFVDSDSSHIRALQERTKGLAPTSTKHIIYGDCNSDSIINEVLERIPDRSLGLTFVDPFALNIDFRTLQVLVTARRMDILLVFQIAGMKRALQSRTERLNRFFGDQGQWYEVYRSSPPSRLTRSLLDYYKTRLSTLEFIEDYSPSEVAITNRRSLPLYYLVLASKHPRGKDFWQKSIQQSASGLRRLPGF